MAHNFRVIESCNEFGRNGEPRYFAVCLEGDIDTGCCYVSNPTSTAEWAFRQGIAHQRMMRGMWPHQDR